MYELTFRDQPLARLQSQPLTLLRSISRAFPWAIEKVWQRSTNQSTIIKSSPLFTTTSSICLLLKPFTGKSTDTLLDFHLQSAYFKSQSLNLLDHCNGSKVMGRQTNFLTLSALHTWVNTTQSCFLFKALILRCVSNSASIEVGSHYIMVYYNHWM